MDRVAEAKFSEFMYSRWLQLVRLGYVLTGDQGLAHDLAQTALARAYSSWPQIRRAGDPDAYVRRVMGNANRSRFRKRRVAEHRPAPCPSRPVDGTGGCDDRVALRAALMSLPVGQRSVVVLRFWLDMSEIRAAAALGCSVGNVKSQVSRALAKLRARKGPGQKGCVVSSFDGQDLGQQIDRALATIAAGPVPTATIVARGRRIRRRRRAAWAGAVAVVAVLGVAIWARCTRLCAAGPWVRRSGS